MERKLVNYLKVLIFGIPKVKKDNKIKEVFYTLELTPNKEFNNVEHPDKCRAMKPFVRAIVLNDEPEWDNEGYDVFIRIPGRILSRLVYLFPDKYHSLKGVYTYNEGIKYARFSQVHFIPDPECPGYNMLANNSKIYTLSSDKTRLGLNLISYANCIDINKDYMVRVFFEYEARFESDIHFPVMEVYTEREFRDLFPQAEYLPEMEAI